MKAFIKKYGIFVFALLILAAGNDVFSQTVVVTAPTPKPAPKIVVPKTPPVIAGRGPVLPVSADRQTNEKSIKVSPKVSLSLCVLEGNVKVSGWDRDEVRVFVKDGSSIKFKVVQVSPQNKEPVWIMVLGFDPNAKGAGAAGECLYGDELEIDVPRGAMIEIKGRETRTTIDSVRKASVKNIGGNIVMRNVSEGVEAATYEGDVSVENSGGAMSLDSLNGNIIAFEVAPSEIGDVFRAKTNNGKIVLQDLSFRQIEVNSISGAINFNGEFADGGLYNFGTSNGSIVLNVPPDTACKINAVYGYGGFNSEFPINKLNEDNTSRFQKIIGTIGGGGDTTLNLTTSGGMIRVRKYKVKEQK